MAVILIAGVPGSGKTTIAFELARIFNIEQVIQTDTVKEIFQINDNDPISFCATHNAWKFFGEKTVENIMRGYEAHSMCFEKTLLDLIELTQKKGKNIIVEGAQITPALFSKINSAKVGFYLYVSDIKEHINRFDQKNSGRNKQNDEWYQNYNAIRVIDLDLKLKCKGNGIILLNNLSMHRTISLMIPEVMKLGIQIGGKSCMVPVIM